MSSDGYFPQDAAGYPLALRSEGSGRKKTVKQASKRAGIEQILQLTGMNTAMNRPSIQVGLRKNNFYPAYSL